MFFKTKRSPRKTTRQTLSTEQLEQKAMFNGTPLPAVESPTTDTASVEIAEEAVVGLKEDTIVKIPSSGSVQSEGVNGEEPCTDTVWISSDWDAAVWTNGVYSYENADESWTNYNKGDEWDSDRPEPFPGFWDLYKENPGWPWCPDDGGNPPVDDDGECPTDDDGTGGTDGGTSGGGTSGGGESGPSDDDDEECPYEMNGDVENDLNLEAGLNNRSSGTTTPRSQAFARMGR